MTAIWAAVLNYKSHLEIEALATRYRRAAK
jgi:hypothetical protein